MPTYLFTYLLSHLLIYQKCIHTLLLIYSSTYLLIYLSTHICIFLIKGKEVRWIDRYITTYLAIYLLIYLSTYLLIYLSTYLLIYLSMDFLRIGKLGVFKFPTFWRSWRGRIDIFQYFNLVSWKNWNWFLKEFLRI